MYQDYRLDERKLRALVAERGFVNFGEVLKKAALHRNSLNEYLDGGRSVFSTVTRKICGVLDCDPTSILIRREVSFGSDSTAESIKKLLFSLAGRYSTTCFFLLGSRAKGTNRQFSDWDIAVSSGHKKLPVNEYLTIKSELEDGVENFPVEVDLINFDEAPRWFLASINYQPKFLAGDENIFSHVIGVIDGARKN